MGSYLPNGESDLVFWGNNFNSQIGTYGTSLGFTAPEVTAIQGFCTDLATQHQAARDAQDAARAIVALKDTAKDSFLKSVRAAVKRIQASPAVTNEIRAAFQITIPDESKSAPAVPTARPVIEVENIEGRTHVLRFVNDETGSHPKPEGTRGVELYMAIADAPPVDEKQMQLVAVPTAAKHVQNFGGADVGKTAWYLPRYISTRDEPGPWGQMIAVTIAA